MGQKVNPIGIRVGITRGWRSKWYASKEDFGPLLKEDLMIRKFIKKRLSFAGIPDIGIERASDRTRIIIYTARPGVVIGRKGVEIDKLKEELTSKTGKEVIIDIEEVKNPNIVAQLVAENIAQQIERRISFRKAMKKAMSTAMSSGALGIKVSCAGRLGGAEIARTEGYKEGKIPLHTLRAIIDYGFTEAHTTYGLIGIKVWIFKGEALPEKKGEENNAVNAQKS